MTGRTQQQELGFALGYQSFYLLIKLCGRNAAYALLYIVCVFYVLFRPQVRAGCDPYLEHRFAHSVGFKRWWRQYLMVVGFARVMVDRAIVAILGAGQISVTLHGQQQLLQVRDQGRGMILLLSHVGCWQLAMSAMGALEEPIHMLMHEQDNSFGASGDKSATADLYRTINPEGYLGGALEMMAVLKGGGILSIMGDRVPEREKNTASVSFLGEQISLPVSAYHLAASTAAPIVVLNSYKSGPDAYEMVVEDVIEVPGGLGRRAGNFTPYVQRYVAHLEEYCRNNPYQFFNFFDMWQ